MGEIYLYYTILLLLCITLNYPFTNCCSISHSPQNVNDRYIAFTKGNFLMAPSKHIALEHKFILIFFFVGGFSYAASLCCIVRRNTALLFRETNEDIFLVRGKLDLGNLNNKDNK